MHYLYCTVNSQLGNQWKPTSLHLILVGVIILTLCIHNEAVICNDALPVLWCTARRQTPPPSVQYMYRVASESITSTTVILT